MSDIHFVKGIVNDLKEMADSGQIAGMMHFGIDVSTALGIKIPQLRSYAKILGKDHDTSLALWERGIHEARLLAIFIAEPKRITEEQMEHWVKDFRSWDICDQACSLFDETPFAYEKAKEWTRRDSEFEKRARFALMATMAIHCIAKQPECQMDSCRCTAGIEKGQCGRAVEKKGELETVPPSLLLPDYSPVWPIWSNN